MSDFLTRIAERTLGHIPVAQPIITPMFAPNILNNNPPDPVWNNEPQIADKARAVPARENLSAFFKLDPVAESRLPDTMIGLNDNNTFEPASKAVKAVNPERLSGYKNLKGDTSTSTSGHNEHFTDMISSGQDQRDRQESEQSFNIQNNSSEIPIDSDKLSITRTQRDVQAQAAPDVQNTKTYNLRSNTTERIRSSHVTRSAPVSSSSTPAIQITIGRIEVRAITPPAVQMPARRPRTHGSTLSLDDYFKQRNGGQR